MDKIITLRVNGRPVRARSGQTVMTAARAVGIDIPSLCHHPAITPLGACRICLVEIERQRTLQPACTFPVSEGLRIETESAPRHLRAGDFADIPARCRHRVEWTAPDQPTVWLAVHYDEI